MKKIWKMWEIQVGPKRLQKLQIVFFNQTFLVFQVDINLKKLYLLQIASIPAVRVSAQGWQAVCTGRRGWPALGCRVDEKWPACRVAVGRSVVGAVGLGAALHWALAAAILALRAWKQWQLGWWRETRIWLKLFLTGPTLLQGNITVNSQFL